MSIFFQSVLFYHDFNKNSSFVEFMFHLLDSQNTKKLKKNNKKTTTKKNTKMLSFHKQQNNNIIFYEKIPKITILFWALFFIFMYLV